MAFAPIFQRPFSATFDRRAAVAAAVPWWLSGGVAAANCLAAYTPKGKASLALSYNNDAAPGNGLADGTYDAAPGTAPTFDAATGWTFNGTDQYLTTGVVPDVTVPAWSAVVRFSNVTNSGACFGTTKANSPIGVFYLRPNVTPVRYANGAKFLDVSPALTSGVLGFAGLTAYRNGSSDGNISAGAGTNSTEDILIAARNLDTGGIINFLAGNILAFAIYDTTLSAAQMLAVSNAMNLL